ncbi:unnamed protein product [Urochloa decumbens]|uniref:UEV domain-containing protein n=1 Tax=Urochloa decumbens TaxID=240449 RepID=A0ABC8VD05_9POAL
MAPSSSLGLGLGGHTFLPYPQAACREIEHHLVSLAAAFPSSSFEATLSPFTHDDGRDAILVNAAGTLPSTGAEVSVWLLEAYPHVAPLVFLTPVSGSIRPAYVDGSGAVTAAPYLRHWSWPDSDLVGLVQSLDVLVRLHDDQPPVPREPSHDAIAEAVTDSACDVRRVDGDTDMRRALRVVQDEKDRLEQELLALSIKEAELLDAVAAEQRAVERAEAEDALDRALQAGRVPLCRYLKEMKDVARAQFMALPVPDDLLARPEHHA